MGPGEMRVPDSVISSCRSVPRHVKMPFACSDLGQRRVVQEYVMGILISAHQGKENNGPSTEGGGEVIGLHSGNAAEARVVVWRAVAWRVPSFSDECAGWGVARRRDPRGSPGQARRFSPSSDECAGPGRAG